MKPVLAAGVVSAVITVLLMPALRALALRHGYLDVPNDASSHERATPRVGGYAMLAAILAGALFGGAWESQGAKWTLLGAAALAALAFVDDYRSLPRSLRLGAQLVVAVVVAHMWEPASAVAWALGTLWVVAVVNGLNFVDGLNGMLGIGSVVGGVFIALIAVGSGNTGIAVLGCCLAGAGLGFLPFNLFSGSVFMGDAGSTTVGILVAGSLLGLVNTSPGNAVAALALTPYLLDAWGTILRRLMNGEPFFSTRHRSSYYQWLEQTGWRHEAVAGLYGLMGILGGATALASGSWSRDAWIFALAVLICVHGVLFFWIARNRHAA